MRADFSFLTRCCGMFATRCERLPEVPGSRPWLWRRLRSALASTRRSSRVAHAECFSRVSLFVDRNDRILYLSTGRGCCVSYPDFEDWRAQAKSFVDMAVVHGIAINLSDKGGFPERYDATEVSSNTFALVGQKPIARAGFCAVRRDTRSRSGCNPDLWVLGTPIWNESGDSRPDCTDEWHGNDCDRGHAAGFFISAEPGFMGAAGSERGLSEAGITQPVVRCGPFGRWRNRRQRPRGDGNHRTQAGERLPADQSGEKFNSLCAEVRRIFYWPKRDDDLWVDVRRSRFCAVDSVRQFGESFPCALAEQVARDFHTRGAGRGAMADRSATPD